MYIDPTSPSQKVMTRDGAPVILFVYMGKQQRAYLGMYYNKCEWIACSWNKDGTYICKESKTGMDLVLIKELLENNNETS